MYPIGDIIRKALTMSESGKMTFGDALNQLKAGHTVCRTGWNGKGMWLELQRPDEHSKMTLPYVYLNYPDDSANTPGARVPWLASQTDMLSEDWMVVDVKPSVESANGNESPAAA